MRENKKKTEVYSKRGGYLRDINYILDFKITI